MLTVLFEKSIYALAIFIALSLNSNDKSLSMTSVFIRIFFLPIFAGNVTVFPGFTEFSSQNLKLVALSFLTLVIDPLLLNYQNNFLTMTVQTHFHCNHYLTLHN